MTPAEFIAFAQARHGEKWIQPMAEETDYSYDQIYGIVHRGQAGQQATGDHRQGSASQAEEAEVSQLTLPTALSDRRNED